MLNPWRPVTKGEVYDVPPRSPAGIPIAAFTEAGSSPGFGSVPVRAAPRLPTFREAAPTAREAFGNNPDKSPPSVPTLNAAALFPKPSEPLESERSAERGYPVHATPLHTRIFPADAVGTHPTPPPLPVVVIS